MDRMTTDIGRTRAAGECARTHRGGRPRERARSGDEQRSAGTHDRGGRRRPARREIEAAALDLIRRRALEILATARRHASTPEDAEDAYQRGLEILLRKAPTTSEDELVPWLKTVVKHEAFALRRQRERHSPVTDDGDVRERATPPGITHDQAARHERLRHGAEALRLLKPQEARGLRLRAEGYSYKEICRLTGWTYTKVNRVLTEGRRALRRNALAIEAGGECERLAPLLGRAATRVYGANELRGLDGHLRSCLSCRARLKSLRASAGAARRGPGSGAA